MVNVKDVVTEGVAFDGDNDSNVKLLSWPSRQLFVCVAVGVKEGKNAVPLRDADDDRLSQSVGVKV